MFGFRSIGKIIRGNATPLQLSMACVLGSMIGFVPGFVQGPGAIVVLLLLLVILNANLALAALVLGGRFIQWSVRLYRTQDNAVASATFRYSIIYLMGLFAALLVDHYLPGVR